MKKLVKTQKADSSENKLVIEEARINPIPVIKVEIFDFKGGPLVEFSQLLQQRSSNKAKVTLTFHSSKLSQEASEGDIMYCLTDLRPSKAKYKAISTEAHLRYLSEKKLLKEAGSTTTHGEGFCGENSDVRYEIKWVDSKEKKEIIVLLKLNENDASVEISENIELLASFKPVVSTSLDDVIEISLPKEPDPFLTKGKIVFGCIMAVVILLIMAFRKKIWTWIKSKTKKEEEKKVEEQLDIF